MNRAAIALCLAGAAIAAAQVREVKYQGTDEDFANPERGFFVQRSYRDRRGALRVEDLRAARGKQLSLVRMLYSLREFRETPLPDDVLASLGADFGRAREAGMKVIPRFSYSSAIGQPDASLERILAHIGQLKPVLRANADVIALFEAGFAGAWGEWHSSTNGLFDAGPGVRYHQVNEKTRAILDALMDALPADHMIVVRCPRFKTVIFGEQPLSTEDGFSGTPKARTGALNDCLDLAPHGVPLPPARCTHSGGCEGGRPPCDELPGDQRGLVPECARDQAFDRPAPLDARSRHRGSGGN